jgi:hypothetical protein
MQLPWIWTPLPSVESQPHAGLTLQVYLHVSPLLSLCMVCLVARWWPFSSFVQVASPSLELSFFPLHLSASLPADQNQEVGWPKPPPRRLPWLIQFLALWALRVLPCSWSTQLYCVLHGPLVYLSSMVVPSSWRNPSIVLLSVSQNALLLAQWVLLQSWLSQRDSVHLSKGYSPLRWFPQTLGELPA